MTTSGPEVPPTKSRRGMGQGPEILDPAGADTFGESVYNPIARRVFDEVDASMVILIVLDGALGNGFCVAQRAGFGTNVPEVMRLLADKVDDRLKAHPLERRCLEEGTSGPAAVKMRPRWRR